VFKDKREEAEGKKGKREKGRNIRARNKGLVAFHIVRNVGTAVAQRLLVEDAKGLVHAAAGVLDFRMDRRKFFVKSPPIFAVNHGMQ
jgi:hypothetical protein